MPYKHPNRTYKKYEGSLLALAKLGSHASRLFGRQAPQKPAKRNATRVLARVKGRRLSLHQNSIPAGIGGYFSNFFYGKKRLPIAKSVFKNLSKNYYVYNTAQRAASTVGVQTAFPGITMFNKTDLQAINALIGANTNVQKTMFLNCSAEIITTNCGLGSVRYTLYDIIARRDLSTSITQTPIYAWVNSYADEGASNGNFAIPGTTPFSSDLFTQMFIVKKITHVDLGEGQSHTHRIRYHPNRTLDREYLINEAYGYRGLTCFTMCVAHGMPSNDATTHSQVSLGASQLDVVTKQQYSYTWINDSTTTFTVSQNLPTSYTVGGELIDQGSGAVAAEAFA